VRSLEAALASPTIPPDIVTTLLNLAEFMEHDEKSLPLDTRCGWALRCDDMHIVRVRVRVARHACDLLARNVGDLLARHACDLLARHVCGLRACLAGDRGMSERVELLCVERPRAGRWARWRRSATRSPRRCTTRSWSTTRRPARRWRR